MKDLKLPKTDPDSWWQVSLSRSYYVIVVQGSMIDAPQAEGSGLGEKKGTKERE